MERFKNGNIERWEDGNIGLWKDGKIEMWKDGIYWVEAALTQSGNAGLVGRKRCPDGAKAALGRVVHGRGSGG